MQPQLAAQLEQWLTRNGHQLVASPLPPEAITTMIDCFVIEDETCARGVIDKRARSESVVFARIDLEAPTTDAERTVTVTAWWFDKGRAAIAERRFCERCTDLTLRSTADDLIAALAKSTKRDIGRLRLTSSPLGARVRVDGKHIGVTPLDHELAEGNHEVVVSHEDREELRAVAIRRGETTAVEVDVTPRTSARLLPYAVLGAGGALLVTGAVLFAIDEDVPPRAPDPPEFYRNTAPAGVGLMIAGGVVTGVGAYLLWSSRTKSAPVAALSSDSGYLGWAGTF